MKPGNAIQVKLTTTGKKNDIVIIDIIKVNNSFGKVGLNIFLKL